ncbi:MAG: membrane-bound lytic murein transglycosylase MltF [Gammaproteobacteria bacterium]|nr:membrane-bound lytic murein transglycosylase MltF [Gammaproteobacteria bacterium]MCZ6880767.1 membrane-bound lytic murein transglycosylase MltF [Gammaproteobacteria bacterium]
MDPLRVVTALLVAVVLGTCSGPPSLVEQIKTLGELRVITRNSPTTYYIGHEGPIGPEYDLVSRFAEELGVELRINVDEELQSLIPGVKSGRAHIAAAGLTITADRLGDVAFGPSYDDISEFLVYRVNTRRPREPKDLIGKSIEVIKGSAHADTLHQLRQRYPDLAWIETPNVTGEELIYQVAQGKIDYTIADSSEFNVSQKFHPEVRVAFQLRKNLPLAWALPRDSPDLHDSVQRFFAGIRKNGELERILEKYYGNVGNFDYVGTRAFLRHIETRLPQFRTSFQQAAADSGMDWRLLAAVGYQESHWNPKAVSPTGVRGIMMLTQLTARQLGIRNRIDPVQSISGGSRYIREMMSRIPERIPEPDRTWLALAAYNVGWGHVEDARIITEIRGLNPDSWVDVRSSLPLLTQKKWYSRVRRGYARGWEPVHYVDNIRSYYDVLLWLYSDSSPFRERLDLDDEEQRPEEPIEA